MSQVDNRIDSARRAAATTQAEVNAISDKLLADVLQRPFREAANFIDAPRLTSTARAALRSHVNKSLSARPRLRTSPIKQALAAVWPVLGWARRHPIMLSSVLATVLCFGVALSNTPTTIGIGRLPNAPEMRWPDGSLQKLDDAYAVIGHGPGEWLIRVWRPFKGYETIATPQSDVVSGR